MSSILLLDLQGAPYRWIDHEKAAYYHTQNKIIWGCGTNSVKLRGGINSTTHTQSVLFLDSIISVKYNPKNNTKTPRIDNRTLFNRDGRQCAYCGIVLANSVLTCDHILPKSLGGKNVWTNIITSCKPCNSHKGSTPLSILKWPLLYQPYIPTKAEVLLISNPNILEDQYNYLLKYIPTHSRVLKQYNNIGKH